MSTDPTDEPLVKKRSPLFLERRSYRQRRVMDALRMMPILGAILWAVPLLWSDGQMPTSRAILYIFGVWAGMVVLSQVLTRRIIEPGEGDSPRAEAEQDIWRP